MSDLRKACEEFSKGTYEGRVNKLLVERLMTFAKRQRSEVWREAAKALGTFYVPDPSSFTAMIFNDACRDLADYCKQQAKEMGL